MVAFCCCNCLFLFFEVVLMVVAVVCLFLFFEVVVMVVAVVCLLLLLLSNVALL